MKKRSGGSKSPATVPMPDLKALIRDHSLFFDRLVELIPARFYLPAADEDRTPFKFLSKSDKVTAREETRQNLKKARRARLDPDKSSTTLDLLHKSIHADKPDDEAPAAADAVENPRRPAAIGDRPVTYEELQQRLHRKIEELRSTRNTRPLNNPRDDKRDKKKNAKNKGGEAPQGGKRKREGEIGEEQGKETKMAKPAPADFSFSQVKIGGDDEMGRRKNKVSKAQALKRAKRLEEAKKDPEKGEMVTKKHSWKAAENRAAGVKVHDDPKLLQQSIKKEKKRHQKHTEQWKERVESRDKGRADKQRTRADNIKERIHQKKTRRIEKREKKLMRPGFEGRKEGFINE